MSLEYSIVNKGTFILAEVSGVFDVGEAIAVTTAMLSACSESGISSLLIDCRRLQGPILTVPRFEYAMGVVEAYDAHVSKGGAQISLVWLAEERLLDPGRMGEKIGISQGMRVKATADEVEALEFLGLAGGIIS